MCVSQTRMRTCAISVYDLSALAKIRDWAITPESYETGLQNFTVGHIISRQCVENKRDNFCFLCFWVIGPWLKFVSGQ